MSDNSHTTTFPALHGLQKVPQNGARVASIAPRDLSYDYGLRVRVAADEVDQATAKELVDQRYAWRGYNTNKGEEGGRYVTLIAELDACTVGTITVRVDSEAGLMVDGSYAEEVDDFRRRGRSICEVTRLATVAQTDSRKVLAVLFHAAIYWARRLVATDLFIEINPRHERFYLRWLDFAVAAGHRICPRVQAPAVLLHLELARAQPDQWLQSLGAAAMPMAA